MGAEGETVTERERGLREREIKIIPTSRGLPLPIQYLHSPYFMLPHHRRISHRLFVVFAIRRVYSTFFSISENGLLLVLVVVCGLLCPKNDIDMIIRTS